MPHILKCECGICKTCKDRAYKRAYTLKHPGYSKESQSKRREERNLQKKKYRERHRERLREERKTYRSRSEVKEKIRAGDRRRSLTRVRKQRLRNTGHTDVYYRSCLQLQDNRCAICRVGFDTCEAHADHDHVTGKPRGVLCLPCNMLTGKVEKNLSLIQVMKDYLALYQTTSTCT